MRRVIRALAFVLLYPLGTAAAEDVCTSIHGKPLLTERQIAQLEKSAAKSEYETSQAYETLIRKLIPNLVAASIEIYDNPILTPFRYGVRMDRYLLRRKMFGY
ncbi:MAG: hypothetical protein JO208_04190 [Alphaproteobacteria bacterium]|nr:hypothetical protein [Alphaproteobacteria bacterium]